MHRSQHSHLSLSDFSRTMQNHPRRWVIPTVAIGALALVYALARTPTWEASQAMIVRDEASGSVERPGKFRHIDEMKTVQETVLEMAKNRDVLAAALAEAGPGDGHTAETWPTERDVADFADAVKLSPPKGAEFGTTEMFYLDVKAETRERSVALASALAHQLQIHCQELRDVKASSIVDELNRSIELARQDLQKSTAELSAIEGSVGRDLAELRILQESPSGDSHLRRTVIEMENELRQVRAAQETNAELLTLLEQAKVDPSNLLAAPTRLLESQPALRRLKEGLVDAQLRTSQLLGTMSKDHPQVQASIAAADEVRENLHNELEIAIRGLQLDQRVTATRTATLSKQLGDATERMNRLATMRAEYANVVAEAKQRTEILRLAEQELSEARASQAAAKAVSLINTVGKPITGTHPVGPGRTTIVLCGIAGGLAVGLAIIFLTAEATGSREPVVATSTNGSAAGHTNGHDLNGARSLSLKEALKKVTARRNVWN